MKSPVNRKTSLRVAHIQRDEAGNAHVRLGWLLENALHPEIGSVFIEYADTGKICRVNSSQLCILGQAVNRRIKVCQMIVDDTGQSVVKEGYLVVTEEQLEREVWVRFKDTNQLQKVPANEVLILGEETNDDEN